MFTKNTVFILGAGASYHYGYPTGEELIERVIKKAEEVVKFGADKIYNESRRYPRHFIAEFLSEYQNKDIADEIQKLADRLRQINPLVIDYFLAQNHSLQSIGRTMIAWVILEC